MLFLGVDGGGTKTEAILCDELGNILSRGIGGPSNLGELDEEEVFKSLRSALSPLKSFLREKTVAVLGMPSVGELKGIEDEYARIFKEIVGFKPDLVVNDVIVAWAGGTLGEDGIHVVAGTGSIAYGRRGELEARSGGWGSLIGDEGSAYHIGVETLRAVSMQIDGRMESESLKDFIFEKMNFKDQHDFVRWIYKGEGDRRSRIASIAILTHEAALRGDGTAVSILERAGKFLSDLVVAISRRLDFGNPLVTYSGGVLTKNEMVREAFKRNLEEKIGDFTLEKALLSPVMGAVVLGMRLKGMKIPWR